MRIFQRACRKRLNITWPSIKYKHLLLRYAATFSVSPSPSLADEHVNVNITGIQPRQKYTLYAEANLDTGNRFYSFGHYQADEKGHIDLVKHLSVGGSYIGCEPMGFIWSMKYHPGNSEKETRYMQRDVSLPISVNLALFNEFSADLDAIEGEKCVAETTFLRYVKAPNVKKEILDGEVKGSLFIPPGEGPFPVLITLYGAVAKYVETKAAVLASHGIMCLALAFYGRPGLPETFWKMDLEYFEKAIEMMNEHPKTSKAHGVAVTGISLGGVLTQAISASVPGVTKSIIVNCALYTDQVGIKYKDEEWPQIPKKFTADMIGKTTWSFFTQPEDPFDKKMTKYTPPFHKNKKIKYLFQYSEDDRNCNSMMYAKHAKLLLDSENHKNYDIKCYPKAGHVLDPPYFPLYPYGYAGFVGAFLPYGGFMYEHHLAQLAAWNDLIQFLKTI